MNIIRFVTLLFIGLQTVVYGTDSLSSKISPYIENESLAGCVAMVVDYKSELHAEALGYSDIEKKKEMSLDSIFWIASQSKSMTAVAVMSLVDQKKIALDDSVSKYLPEFSRQLAFVQKQEKRTVLEPPIRPITIRDILSHMSGLPFRSELEQPTLDALPIKVAVGSYALSPLQAHPGMKYQYSNAGIKTAARVLEVVTGQSYESYMDDFLFGPLGMKDTTFWPTSDQVSRIANSYRPNKGKNGLEKTMITQLTYPLSNRLNRFPMPGGGLFSTARDTSKFCQMMLNKGVWKGKRYLSENAFEELTKKQTPDSIKLKYGLGFSLGDGSFGHGGAHSTNMEIRQKDGIALIWMVQHAGFPKNGRNAQSEFKSWAINQFAKKR